MLGKKDANRAQPRLMPHATQFIGQLSIGRAEDKHVD